MCRVAPRTGLEPVTRCLEGSRSIQLSYRGEARNISQYQTVAGAQEMPTELPSSETLPTVADQSLEFTRLLPDRGRDKSPTSAGNASRAWSAAPYGHSASVVAPATVTESRTVFASAEVISTLGFFNRTISWRGVSLPTQIVHEATRKSPAPVPASLAASSVRGVEYSGAPSRGRSAHDSAECPPLTQADRGRAASPQDPADLVFPHSKPPRKPRTRYPPGATPREPAQRYAVHSTADPTPVARHSERGREDSGLTARYRQDGLTL